MKKTKLSLIVHLTMAAFLVPNSFAEIYELRTYTSHEGKLESVLNRFENHTMSLFEKHGIKLADRFAMHYLGPNNSM